MNWEGCHRERQREREREREKITGSMIRGENENIKLQNRSVL